MAKDKPADDPGPMGVPDADGRSTRERIADVERAIARELASQRKANAHVADPKVQKSAAEAIAKRDEDVRKAMDKAHDELAAALAGQGGHVRILRG